MFLIKVHNVVTGVDTIINLHYVAKAARDGTSLWFLVPEQGWFQVNLATKENLEKAWDKLISMCEVTI